MRTRRPAAEQLHADELCRSRLENQIDLRHPLVQLSHRLPWSALEQALSPQLPATTGTGGRPALPVRLIAGLLYLKHAYDLSDEAVCARWLENPYWQFFTGEVVFQTCVPCDPSSLTRWRQRLGEAGMEALLAHTINTAHTMKAVDARELSRVIVDTTVQEKRSPIPPTAVCWRWRASWCCWPTDTASHCDRTMRGKVRRSNENTNGLLRQFMPKGVDLSKASQEYLNNVADLMNARPRQTLGWKTSNQALEEEIAQFNSRVALAS